MEKTPNSPGYCADAADSSEDSQFSCGRNLHGVYQGLMTETSTVMEDYHYYNWGKKLWDEGCNYDEGVYPYDTTASFETCESRSENPNHDDSSKTMIDTGCTGGDFD